MVPDYGVASNARNRTVSFFFVPSVSFLVKSPYVIFFISTSRSQGMLRFQNVYVLKFIKQLCTAFKNFHVKNISIMTSGCVFKNGAPTQVLRKVHILTKFGLCYTMRENIEIREMQISFILCIYCPSYATFSTRRFLLTSV